MISDALPLGLALLAADRVPSGREMYDEAERLQKAERLREAIRREVEGRGEEIMRGVLPAEEME